MSRKSNREKRVAKGRRTPSRLIVGKLLSNRQIRTRDAGLHVISAMRQDPKLSLTRAAKQEGIKPSTVLTYFHSVFAKSGGRFHVRKSDRLSTTLYVPDANGNPVPVQTHSSKERQQLSRYLRDLGRYLRGQRDALAPWHGKKVAGVELVTAARVIESIEPALSDFSLYRSFNGGER